MLRNVIGLWVYVRVRLLGILRCRSRRSWENKYFASDLTFNFAYIPLLVMVSVALKPRVGLIEGSVIALRLKIFDIWGSRNAY